MIRPSRPTAPSRFTDAAENSTRTRDAQPLELFVENAGTAARFLPPFLCLG
jgi:5-enolpyruvylshikimate-3-phosphate synthase